MRMCSAVTNTAQTTTSRNRLRPSNSSTVSTSCSARASRLGDRGCLIAFEGIEGAGKSTQMQLVGAVLRARGIAVVETREPGGTQLGAEMRRILMHLPDATPTPMAELLLYLADRAQHLAEVIRPALVRGDGA